MRIYFLLVVLACGLHANSWAQLRVVPLEGYAPALHQARTQATSAYTTTLRLPYFYDFDSKYLQIDSISRSAGVIVYTVRPHGLLSYDSVTLSGAKAPTDLLYFSGIKYVSRISDYAFQLYQDKDLTDPSVSSADIDYLRISKYGAEISVRPDTLAFYDNQGGVLINSGYALKQPSSYVASFDGINAAGVPYNTSNQFAVGYTDSLRSQPFDLTGYSPGDNIYMSFNYQHGGNGEQPDANDKLYLEFMDNTHQWNTVYTASSAGDLDSFYVAMVPINDMIYFHDQFQYRFRSYGRQSGSYDVWNLDYIYIDTNRTASDPLIYDFALRDAEHCFLQRYTSMPFNHFFVDPTVHVKTALNMTIINQKVTKKSRVMELMIQDQFGDTIYNEKLPSETDSTYIKNYTFTPVTYSFGTTNQPLYIDQIYSFDDGQRIDFNITPLDMMFNNVLTQRTYLYDYYAYDDSQAEAGFGTDQAGTRIAVRYVAQAKDTLTHIDMCFTRSKEINLEGSQIFLMVWTDSLHNDNTFAYKSAISIHYQSSPNAFTRYALDAPLILDSGQVYYIGYLQNLPYRLTLGFDKNNNAMSNTFYNESNQWVQVSSDPSISDQGSMMIRPVFYKESNHVPVGVTPPLNDIIKNGLLLYPNPTASSLHVLLKDNISPLQYTIYSLYGQILYQGTITPEDNEILLSGLSPGMYLITCTDLQRRTYSSRFIKE